MRNPDFDYHLHNITMGKLKNKRPSGHSFVEYVESQSRRGPVVRERVIQPTPPTPQKWRASTSPSKTGYSTPDPGDYHPNHDDEPRTPKRIRVGQKVSASPAMEYSKY
jgi:hypothetical protein